ncbi:hypothetical protein [Agreia bicolorata]|uniref:Bacitracin resistance protein n=1 Tax=Agreia bicolorata TaxID=110935 RepID=A0ABR5CE50_9MICO|nr:hypothetical protein [Agreia bicolorata]KJC63904.1 hypothetical protein TZ00_12955 [Agreia bicolorata]
MTKNTSATPNSAAARSTFRDLSFSKKLGWGIALLFALISAIWVWVGVANLFEAIATFGLGLSGVSWLVFVGSIAAPIVTYALGFLVGWRLPAWAKAVVFLVALAVAMVIKADLESLLLGGL